MLFALETGEAYVEVKAQGPAQNAAPANVAVAQQVVAQDVEDRQDGP